MVRETHSGSSRAKIEAIFIFTLRFYNPTVAFRRLANRGLAASNYWRIDSTWFAAWMTLSQAAIANLTMSLKAFRDAPSLARMAIPSTMLV
jgi:hypothetical protein